MDIVQTDDGSHTLSSRYSGEHYHSTHGAQRESQHVFIRQGIASLESRAPISVLEMGFGTGLNALLTQLFAARTRQRVAYVTIEAEPVPLEVVELLNYGRMVEGATVDLFARLHAAPWDQTNDLDEWFTLQKVQARIEDVPFDPHFDVVYYDAFGPNYQPELWTQEAFAHMYGALRPGGILVTYCAKGQVKRDLRAVGFTVESLPGPPGKREMTRARKAE